MQGYGAQDLEDLEITSSALGEGVDGRGGRAHEVAGRQGASQRVAQSPQRVLRLLHNAARGDAPLRLVQAAPALRLRQHLRHLLRLPGSLHTIYHEPDQNPDQTMPQAGARRASALCSKQHGDAALYLMQFCTTSLEQNLIHLSSLA